MLLIVEIIRLTSFFSIASAFSPSIVSFYDSVKFKNHRKNNHLPYTLCSSSSSSTLLSSSSSSSSSIGSASPPAISVDSLTCSHDGGNVFQLKDASYVLPRGARVGLVGKNGCGKSTFFKIVANACTTTNNGREDPTQQFQLPNDSVYYTGRIEKSRDCKVGYVEQDPPCPMDVTVMDALLGIEFKTFTATAAITSSSITSTNQNNNNAAYEAAQMYHQASLKAESNPKEFAVATENMDLHNGWYVFTKVKEVATRLNVMGLQDRLLCNLSGGERKRVALAAALIKEPDVLLLDEPTNHLDLAAIRWLSNIINNPTATASTTFLIITHDRAFLQDVCTSILELDHGHFYTHDGNYNKYLEAKAHRIEIENQAYQAKKSKYKIELEWMRRQPQARESKQKARQDAFHRLNKAMKPRPKEDALDLGNTKKEGQRRMGGNVLKLKHVSLRFTNTTTLNKKNDEKDDTSENDATTSTKIILNDFTYDFNKGDRIGIVGSNGVGKSTFVNVLLGKEAIDSGTIETGETVIFGAYDQMGIHRDNDDQQNVINDDQRVMDFVKERVEARDGSTLAEAPNEARKLLQKFQFAKDRWNERVSMLSGGEKRRLQLLSVLTKRPNFLILDEPTNDIDLDTLTALELYLEDFDGVLLVVSHDRYFTDKVTDHLFIFEGNGVVKDYLGSLSDYAECLVVEQENAMSSSSTSNASGNVSKNQASLEANKQQSYKEDKKARMQKQNSVKKMKREMDKIEPAIDKLRIEAEAIQQEIDASADEGWTVLSDLTNKLNAINEEVDTQELSWLELAEQIEEIEAEEKILER